MSRRPIGELMVERGLVTQTDLRQALTLQSQRTAPGSTGADLRLGHILVEIGATSDEVVARLLAEQFNLPYVDPLEVDIDRGLINLVPRQVVDRYQLLPIKRVGSRILVAMADPLDTAAVDDLRFLLRCEISIVVAPIAQLRRAVERYYDLAPQAKRLLAGAEPVKQLSTRGAQVLDLNAADLAERLERGDQKTYVDLVSLLFVHSIEAGASDIHLDPQQDSVRVRFRIDGMLRDKTTLPPWAGPPMVSRLKVLADLDVANRVRPQDGKFAVSIDGMRIDARVAVMPSQFGEKVVIRLLDPGMLLTDLGRLGWEPRALSIYYHMVTKPRGLVLCVGPTGSGKTTTLYATIARLRAETASIITVEDPIEYTLDGVAQIQVHTKSGMTFATSIRSILRQDADVIVVGEIRDAETAMTGVEAATTGHLVLSTLHTTQTVSTIVRLLELQVPPYLLGDALVGIVAQRLIRRVCAECSEEGVPQAEDWERLGIDPIPLGEHVRHVGPGCTVCGYTGYKGRVGVFEVLPISDALRSLILQGAGEQALWAQARTESLVTLLDDALQKAAVGLTTLEEIARVVPVDPWRSKPATRKPRPITAPAAEQMVRIAPEPSAPPVEDPPQSSRDKVLIVDDAAEILNLIALTLEDEYDIMMARDGIEALETVEREMPDLVLLDVMMPRMSGYEVCDALRANPKTSSLPVIMLSARGQRTDIKEGLRRGADDYLPKPFDPEELLLRVRSLLRRARG